MGYATAFALCAVAALVCAPFFAYAVYRLYAAFWAYRLWQLNG